MTVDPIYKKTEERDTATRSALIAFAERHRLTVTEERWFDFLGRPDPVESGKAQDGAFVASGALPGDRRGWLAYLSTARWFNPGGQASNHTTD